MNLIKMMVLSLRIKNVHQDIIPGKHTFLFFVLILQFFIWSSCKYSNPEIVNTDWQNAERIVKGIIPPVFPDQNFYLTDFGGKGDGVLDNKAAFDRVIELCSKQGGGNIVVQKGNYLINGPIHLKSNIHLQLEEGCKLIFGSDPKDYLPLVLTSWEGTRLYNYSPFIYTINSENVAITGKGEICGNASQSWAKWKLLQNKDKLLSRKMNNEDLPLNLRLFGEGHFLRPHLIQFYNCKNILVEGFKISDSPFWCLHLVFSKNIIIRDLQYNALNYNNDGIDPESCSDVLIENISFNNNDDNVAIKAGRDREGRSLSIPSQNIVIRDCLFKGHNAIAVGSEMSGGVNNVYVENCSYAGDVIYGIYLKGNRDRGGEVRDIYVRNIDFDTTVSVILIDSDYKGQGSCCPPTFKNIYIDNIKCNYAKDYGISINAYIEKPVDSVDIRNVNIQYAKNPFNAVNVEHLSLSGIFINEEEIVEQY